MLENHADLLPAEPQLLSAERQQILSAYEHFARIRTLKQISASDQCTFPRAGQPDHAENIIFQNGK